MLMSKTCHERRSCQRHMSFVHRSYLYVSAWLPLLPWSGPSLSHHPGIPAIENTTCCRIDLKWSFMRFHACICLFHGDSNQQIRKGRPQKPSHYCHRSNTDMASLVWVDAQRNLTVCVANVLSHRSWQRVWFVHQYSRDWTQTRGITLFATMHLLLVQKASHPAFRRNSLLSSPSNMEISQHERIQGCHAMTCGSKAIHEPCRVLPTCTEIALCIMVY